MSRLETVDRNNTSDKTGRLLDGVEKKLGMLPNMIATMAHSESVLQSYLSFSQSLSTGVIPPTLREQIALTVAESNQCGYCLAAHSAIGASVGLTGDELSDARLAASLDRKTEAALRFARRIVLSQGGVSDEDVAAVRDAGYGDEEIAEIIGHVALNTFTNYFNRVADTSIDFPRVPELTTS